MSNTNSLKEEIMKTLSEIYDPELYVDIVSLGLIYDVEVSDNFDVIITMTLTTPACPHGPVMIDEIIETVGKNKKLRKVVVDVTFEPPWTPDKIDPDIRAALNI